MNDEIDDHTAEFDENADDYEWQCEETGEDLGNDPTEPRWCPSCDPETGVCTARKLKEDQESDGAQERASSGGPVGSGTVVRFPDRSIRATSGEGPYGPVNRRSEYPSGRAEIGEPPRAIPELRVPVEKEEKVPKKAAFYRFPESERFPTPREALKEEVRADVTSRPGDGFGNVEIADEGPQAVGPDGAYAVTTEATQPMTDLAEGTADTVDVRYALGPDVRTLDVVDPAHFGPDMRVTEPSDPLIHGMPETEDDSWDLHHDGECPFHEPGEPGW